MSDADLLSRYLKDRDEGAFAALVRNHQQMVVGAAWRWTGDAEMARDVAQQVFAILAHKAWMLAGRRSVAGWLHIAATHLAFRTRRAEDARRRRQGEFAGDVGMGRTEADGGRVLEEAISSLGVTEREALVMHYFEDQSYAEIARALGLKEAAVRKRVSRGLEHLAKQLRRRGVGGSAVTTLVGAAAMQAQLPAAFVAGATFSIPTAAAGSSATLFITTLMGNSAFKIATVIAVVSAVPIVWQNRVNAQLRAEAGEMRGAAVQIGGAIVREQEGVDVLALQGELAALSGRLAVAQQSGKDLKEKLAQGQQALDRMQQEVLVKFGRTEELARTFASKLGEILPVFTEFEKGPPTDAEGRARVERAMKVMVELLPYIGQLRQMDEQPDQAGRFMSVVLGNLMDLPAQTTAELERTIADGYANLKRDGLTLSSRPAENLEGWKERRAAVDRAMTARVITLLPENARNHPILKIAGDEPSLVLPPESAVLGAGGVTELLKANPGKPKAPQLPKQP